jgi:hypothetical protein
VRIPCVRPVRDHLSSEFLDARPVHADVPTHWHDGLPSDLNGSCSFFLAFLDDPYMMHELLKILAERPAQQKQLQHRGQQQQQHQQQQQQR